MVSLDSVKSTQRSQIYIRLKLFGECDREIAAFVIFRCYFPVEFLVAISRNGIARLTTMRLFSDNY